MKTDCPAWAPPLLAVQFLTRVPVPGLARLTEAQARAGLERSVRWFPLVGTFVGAVTAATMLLAEQLWPRAVAVVLALTVEARLTGAFHEDAVADFCDAFGGGRDPAHVRQIMKDSRIGSYGALGLMLAIALRAVLMFSLDTSLAALAIIAAATFGRLLVVVVMAAVIPAPSGEGLSKNVGGNIHAGDAVFATFAAVPGLLACALAAPAATLAAFIAGTVFLVWYRALLRRRLGGSTGDCLGFAAYMGQLVFLLAAVAS